MDVIYLQGEIRKLRLEMTDLRGRIAHLEDRDQRRGLSGSIKIGGPTSQRKTDWAELDRVFKSKGLKKKDKK